MTEIEIEQFIAKMKLYGDAWSREEVLAQYGALSLEKAIEDRMFDISEFSSITGMVIDED